MSNTRIALTRTLPGEAMPILAATGGEVAAPAVDRPLRREELLAHVAGAEAIVAMLYDRIDAEVADAAGTQLRVVANVAVGYENLAVEELSGRGVVLTNTPGVLDDATADLALALLLMLTRRLGEGERLVRAGRKWRWDLEFMVGTGIQDKLLGIVGLGRIGRAVARRAHALGMRIAYARRSGAPPEVEAELGARRLELDELLATADVVSLHLPLSDRTRHLVGARRLAAMKRSAYLINTARGPIVDEAALVEALRDGEIAGAGLDVFEREPEVERGLLDLENVVLLPHLGSATVETRAAMAELAARNVAAVLAGRPPLTPIAPQP